MSPIKEIQSSVNGFVGQIRLNNPKSLNSLTEEMCLQILQLLNQWSTNELVQIVVVTGEGDRAFCAGGDVRQVSEEGKRDPIAARRFFNTEYRMDLAISEFSKPYISIIDSIVMGGGLGISINGRYRVMGDNVIAAMPETGIGLIPDVGATAFLNACPGNVGLYLGLTGARLDTADSIYAGFGTHYVPTNKHHSLLAALTSTHYGDNPFSTVENLLDHFSVVPGSSKLEESRSEIEQQFSANNLDAIIESLRGDDSQFASKTLKAIKGMSPTSLKITAKQILENPNISLRDALILEYRIVSNVLMNHDFYEGIRAALVDKDRSPVWNPKYLADVTPEIINDHFASLGEDELSFNTENHKND